MEQRISIPTDGEGYFSLECPYCKEIFKVAKSDFDSEDTVELFCPSCGLVDENNKFIPISVIEHAQTLAMNHIKRQLNDTFKKSSRNIKGPNLTFKYKKLKEEQPKLLTENEKMEQVQFHCCNKTIKVHADQTIDNIYCPFCGVI